MKNLSIRRGLSALFIFLFSTLVVFSAVATFGLMSVNGSLKTVYEDRLVCVGQQDAVIRLLERNHYLISRASQDDDAKMGEYESQIKANQEEAKRIWDSYLSTFIVPEEKKLIDDYQANYARYEQVVLQPAQRAFQNKDKQTLVALFTFESETIFGNVRQSMSKLIQLQLDIGEQEFLQSQSNFTLINVITILILFVALVLLGAAAWWLNQNLSKPLVRAVGLANTVAQGDLTQVIVANSKNETGTLINALAKMNFGLLDIVTQLRTGADCIVAATSDIARGNRELSHRTENQASSLQETASAMEELTVTVQNNADNAQVANKLVGEVTRSAVEGGRVVEQVVANMDLIKERSSKIVDIISVIDGIAFQTNILALNAAVEAARAGEQGRGFAVVATEVRSLAQRSAHAALEIKHLINESVETVAEGDRLVGSAGETMRNVVTSIQQVADLMADIAAASVQQRAGIEQINGAIGEMDHVTQQNTALVEEATAATESLRDQAQVLLELVRRFKTAQVDSARATDFVPAHANLVESRKMRQVSSF